MSIQSAFCYGLTCVRRISAAPEMCTLHGDPPVTMPPRSHIPTRKPWLGKIFCWHYICPLCWLTCTYVHIHVHVHACVYISFQRNLCELVTNGLRRLAGSKAVQAICKFCNICNGHELRILQHLIRMWPNCWSLQWYVSLRMLHEGCLGELVVNLHDRFAEVSLKTTVHL